MYQTWTDTCATLIHVSRNNKWIRNYFYSRPLFEKSGNIKFRNIIFLRLAFFQKVKSVLVKLPVIFEVFRVSVANCFMRKVLFFNYTLWKRCCKARGSSQRLKYVTPILLLWCLSTPVSSWIKDSLFASFTTSVRWLLAYFFLYFLRFEIRWPNLLNYDLIFFIWK